MVVLNCIFDTQFDLENPSLIFYVFFFLFLGRSADTMFKCLVKKGYNLLYNVHVINSIIYESFLTKANYFIYSSQMF